MTCREMSRTTKEPCGKPLPCADHSTPTSTPAAPQSETEGMTFDEWWRTEGLALDTHLAIRIARAAWTAAKGGR